MATGKVPVHLHGGACAGDTFNVAVWDILDRMTLLDDEVYIWAPSQGRYEGYIYVHEALSPVRLEFIQKG
jgi:hypothetical protein